MIEHPANEQPFIRRLTEIILANLGDEKFGVKELVQASGMSHRSLNQRLQAITNKTINQFIREVRLEKALEMLQNGKVTASEVAYKVGFGSPAYFNTCFHEFFGYPPGKVSKGGFDTIEEINTSQTTVEQEQKRPVRRTILITLSAILFFAVLAFLVYNFLIKNPSDDPVIPAELEKSIAVLPFTNLSDTLANRYIYDGVMEEILTNLSRIHDLRVISRTSIEQFRDSKIPTTEIAKKLNVNYIVEGSGQKYGNTFRLRVQLIRAKGKETHLWANSYEQEIRETKDIFKIQSQVAQDIAIELKAGITSEEEDLMKKIPTSNFLAYDYFIRGMKYNSEMIFDTAISIFSKAIKQDSLFMLAYLARASSYSMLYFTKQGTIYNYVDSKGFDSLAKADLEMALKISPNSPEAKLEQADQLYRLDRNYDRSLTLLDELKDQLPNNSSYYFLRGCVLRRKGRWDESLKEMYKATLLDPLNNLNYSEIGNTYVLIRRYAQAIEFFNKPKMLGLNYVSPIWQFLTAIYWKGDLQEALKISGLNISDLEPQTNLIYNGYYYSRQFDKIIPVADIWEDQVIYFPKALNLAHLYFLLANISLSRAYADSAITELKIKVKESPEGERYYSALSYAYAYKGEKREAIENAKKAVKILPLKSDAINGYWKEIDLAKIYILTGEYDKAMDIIESFLTIPGDLSVPLLKIDPAYDKLRALPRFQRILETEYVTKY
jgi:TolB-like protein/AraC-like DNA-binding protein